MAFDILLPRPLLLVLSAAVQGVALVSAPRLSSSPSPFIARLSASLTAAFVSMVILDLLLWVIYVVAIYPHFFSPLRHLPCPKGAHPILGHAKIQFQPPRGEAYLRFIKDPAMSNHGLIRLKGIFNQDTVLLTNAKALAEVLVTRPYEFPKPDRHRDILRRTIGDGLVVAEGAQHRRQRKHSLPSFAFRQIKGLYPLFWEKAVKMTKCIDAEVFGKGRQHQPHPNNDNDKDNPITAVTDIGYWAPKATLDIIGLAGLGRDFNTLENSDDKIVGLYEALTSTSSDMQILLALQIVGGRRLANLLCPSAARRMDKTAAELRDLSEQLVRDKRAEAQARRKASDGDGDGDRDGDSPSHSESIDTLASLMKADVFSDQELVDQLLTIIAAGHETTSSAFTWTIYLLCLHPDIQTRLREEIHAALPLPRDGDGDGNGNANANGDATLNANSLPLLNGVCSETLRVFPTVPVTARTNKQATTLLDQPLAAGTRILVAPWAINKDPAVWGDDADDHNHDHDHDHDHDQDHDRPKPKLDRPKPKPKPKFNPTAASSNYAFLTFLHGPRSCIGQNFARAELRALVAAFVGAYECVLADPDADVVPAGMATTKPKGGLNVRLTKVRGW
ncbi:hypothetical protein A1O3_00963 [Capronia epimyces CBS 606.96]|uniref:Cytochrome P450 oxidoreductase n=1 Tax=Capronia epimyces CBS 606.96 TaxID=1182542 RepID=W9YHS1_9EURO|nr:uncharacterized protein A1O3_00963 [Capronia epimyces CBS 606.96]EXJ92412.1 hypothetical protein A1O3_00963 [Capronia epimyces CBS 606.96]